MNLSVSNIAWAAEEDCAAFDLLEECEIQAVEVAPTRYWPGWHDLSVDAALLRRADIEERNFRVSSLQALLFEKPLLQLFGAEGTRVELANHLERCAELSGTLGAKNMVFGAPKNRNPPVEMPAQEAFSQAVEFFRNVAPRLEVTGSVLAIEANPAEYGATFLASAWEAARLVRAVDAKGVRLHLDTACMHLADDDWRNLIQENIDILSHFHVSEPFLADFSNPILPHAEIARLLAQVGYKGWVTLEMRRPGPGLPAVRKAVEFLVGSYGDRCHAAV